MSNRVKHTFSFQEFRRTLFLNLHAKDDYGRHRGHVLYGMKVQPVAGSTNVVQVGSGALYTALGTRLYWDVASSPETVIDLTTVKIGADPAIQAAAASRPFAIAITAQTTTHAEQVPAIEKPEDAGTTATVRFSARLVSVNRAHGQPAQRRLAADPVTMEPYTDGSDELLAHIDTVNTPAPGVTAPADPSVGSSPAEDALQNNEILLGYVLVGCAPDGTLPTSFADPTGAWRPGVAFVPMYNPHEAVADMLGIDPMAGRVADLYSRGVGPTQGNRALRQAAEESLYGPDAASATAWGHPVPAFGTTDPTGDGASAWATSWSTYRWPNFMRDGEPLLWAMRRMDYVLRLWMDRTGDQALIGWTQDTHIDGRRDFQAPLQQLLRQFNGSSNSQSPTAGLPGNANQMQWGTGSPTSDDNHVIIDGVVGHVLGAETPSVPWGDTHLSAIKALDRALWHVLSDVLGRTFRKTNELRSPALWPQGITGRQFRNDGPAGLLQGFTNWPTCAGACSASAVYLDEQKLYDAIERVAGRTTQGVGRNLLSNPRFLASQCLATGAEVMTGNQTNPPPGWSMVAGAVGTWARTRLALDGSGWRSAVKLDVNGTTAPFGFQQSVGASNGALRSLAENGAMLSARATLAVPSGAAPVVLVLTGFNGASQVFKATSPAIGPTTSNATPVFRSVGFTVQLSAPGQDITHLQYSLQPADPLTATALNFSLLEAGLNFGLPEAAGLGAGADDDYLSRLGGPASKMLGHLDMGGQLIRNAGNCIFNVGDVKMTARDQLPASAYGEQWGYCDGTAYDKTAYADLYAAIGDAFTPAGERGGSIFRVPAVGARAIMGAGGTSDGRDARSYGRGDTPGEFRHQQSQAEMAAHTHSYDQVFVTVASAAGHPSVFWGAHSAQTGSAGGNEPANVMQPGIVFHFFIRLK